MKLRQIERWIERELEFEKFDDVSNNGLQIAREGDDIKVIAFAVDGSVASIKDAAKAGAQLLVVHHGISWGGGIRRLTGPQYNVVKAAMDANIALYAVHLPLDASLKYGNNREIARLLGLRNLQRAFSYHGNLIGLVGMSSRRVEVKLGNRSVVLRPRQKVGVCSGGAGEFAVEAKELGCNVFITGEASWGEVIAAQNVNANLTCCGHYETETFGVNALARAVAKHLGIAVVML